jgi:hypothetical protein
MKKLFFLTSGLLAVVLLGPGEGQSQQGRQPGGAGGQGAGGRGTRGAFDPGNIFDMLDKDKKGYITIDDVPAYGNSKTQMQAYMDANNLTRLNKEQYTQAFNQLMQSSGRGRGGPGGTGTPGATTQGSGSGSGSGPTDPNQPQVTITLPPNWGQPGGGQGNQPGGLQFTWGQQPPPPAKVVEDEDKRPTVYRKGKIPKELPDTLGDVSLKTLFAKYDEAQIFLYDWRAAGGKDDDFFAMDRNNDGILTVEELIFALKIKVTDPQMDDTSTTRVAGRGMGAGGQGAGGRQGGRGNWPGIGGGGNGANWPAAGGAWPGAGGNSPGGNPWGAGRGRGGRNSGNPGGN